MKDEAARLVGAKQCNAFWVMINLKEIKWRRIKKYFEFMELNDQT